MFKVAPILPFNLFLFATTQSGNYYSLHMIVLSGLTKLFTLDRTLHGRTDTVSVDRLKLAYLDHFVSSFPPPTSTESSPIPTPSALHCLSCVCRLSCHAFYPFFTLCIGQLVLQISFSSWSLGGELCSELNLSFHIIDLLLYLYHSTFTYFWLSHDSSHPLICSLSDLLLVV